MSDRPRCVTVKWHAKTDDGKALRSVCDRPAGHTEASHRGRLMLGSEVLGILQWKEPS